MMQPKTIFRISERDRPFVMVSKDLIEDPRLSWRAKGILIYLLSKPDNWKVVSDDILNHGTEGRDSIRSCLQELKSFGYATLINTRDGRVWEIHECPKEVENEPCPEKANMAKIGKPCPEKANMAKIGTSNKDKLVSNNKNNKENDLFSLSGEEQETDEVKIKPIVTSSSEKEKALGNKEKKRSGTVNGVKPSMEEMENFCEAKGLPRSDGSTLFHKWEGTGWKVGSNAIKNWQSTIIAWRGQGYLPSQRNPSGVVTKLSPKPKEEHPQYAGFIANHPSKTMKRFADWSNVGEIDWLKTEFRKFLATGVYEK